jgi:hypothetical protein
MAARVSTGTVAQIRNPRIAVSQYSHTDIAGVVATLEALDVVHAPPAALAALLVAWAGVSGRIAARLATASTEAPAPARAGPERLISVAEAAARLGVKPQWIYEHQKRLPFVRRVGDRALRASEPALERYIATRTRL